MPANPLPARDLEAIVALTPFADLRGANIFITGGTGFFGHWLLESLLHANRTLALGACATVLTRNVASFREKAPHIATDAAITLLQGDVATFAFPAVRHTHILHAATDSVVRTTESALAASILAGTHQVLDFAAHTGADRLLYISSGAVYGRNITTVDRIPETFPLPPQTGAHPATYDEAKRASEALCFARPAINTSLSASIARCFAFLGPHLPLDAHFASGNFIRDAIAGNPIHIRGDGTPLRSFLYMADLATWLWTMLARSPNGSIYNVGSDESVSIADLAYLTATTLRPALTVQIDGTPSHGATPATYVPTITRAQQQLALSVTVRLAEAIRRTAAWHGFQPR